MTLVNKHAVAQAFGRAAPTYQQHAGLQRRSGEHLMALLNLPLHQRLLDAGCGTGWFSRRWRQQGHAITALDLSPGMLAQAEQLHSADAYLMGDIEALPLPEGAFDGVWSHLAVQWCESLPQALKELTRVTRVGGQVAFSTLEAASLPELTLAWQALGAPAPVNRFLSQQAIQQACAQYKVRLVTDRLTEHFISPLAALQSLKGIGATHLHSGQSRPMLSKARLRALEAVWPRDAQGYRLSYQLVYGVIEVE